MTRPPSSRKGMHVRRGGSSGRRSPSWSRALARSGPSSVKPEEPTRRTYEGLPPNWWMPGTNAKCPTSPAGDSKESLSLGPKRRVVAQVEEDVSCEGAVRLKCSPPSTAGRIAFVVAVPRKLETWPIVDCRFPTIHPAFDGDEPKSSRLVGAKLDERGADEIECVSIPKIHLLDSPPTDERFGSLTLAPSCHEACERRRCTARSSSEMSLSMVAWTMACDVSKYRWASRSRMPAISSQGRSGSDANRAGLGRLRPHRSRSSADERHRRSGRRLGRLAPGRCEWPGSR